jgi:hypothetical protein
MLISVIVSLASFSARSVPCHKQLCWAEGALMASIQELIAKGTRIDTQAVRRVR